VERATIAILNGSVWPAIGGATSVAVAGERIVAVGSDREILDLVDAGTRLLDARGGTIMPAFNDAHIHFLSGSRALGQLDLFGAETQEDVEQRIREFAGATKAPWVVGRGWLYSAFPGGMPTLDLLDRLVPDRPAFMESYDAHTAWVNSRALAVAGQAPGDPPGIRKEAAMDDIERHLPARSGEQDLAALRRGMRHAAAHGIASVQEASRGLEQLPRYEELRGRDELTLRVRLAFDMGPGHSMAAWVKRLDVYEEVARATEGDDWIRFGVVKAFVDGVIESRTASVLEPYAGMAAGDAGALGAPNWEKGELAEAVRIASARGWQVQLHAIGDAAIREALNALAGAEHARRHRVEHVEAPAVQDIARFGQVGVIASMQPQHAEPGNNLMSVWAANLGPERAARGWPWASIARAGGKLAFGSDWPVVPIDPFLSVHIAVNRQTRAGEPAGGWVPSERLSLETALAAWTSGSAYAEQAEDRKGALREGMLADIAVLDRDISKPDAGDIASTKVEATVAGGRLVYESRSVGS
jgi:predicted amidohydrolase YtcJ